MTIHEVVGPSPGLAHRALNGIAQILPDEGRQTAGWPGWHRRWIVVGVLGEDTQEKWPPICSLLWGAINESAQIWQLRRAPASGWVVGCDLDTDFRRIRILVSEQPGRHYDHILARSAPICDHGCQPGYVRLPDPYPPEVLQVFEVDHPATQAWKQGTTAGSWHTHTRLPELCRA